MSPIGLPSPERGFGLYPLGGIAYACGVVYAYGMTYTPTRDLDAVLIDTETGTILDSAKVVIVPGDVYRENEAGLDGASDSVIGAFGERYGLPMYVFVMDGE